MCDYFKSLTTEEIYEQDVKSKGIFPLLYTWQSESTFDNHWRLSQLFSPQAVEDIFFSVATWSIAVTNDLLGYNTSNYKQGQLWLFWNMYFINLWIITMEILLTEQELVGGGSGKKNYCKIFNGPYNQEVKFLGLWHRQAILIGLGIIFHTISMFFIKSMAFLYSDPDFCPSLHFLLLFSMSYFVICSSRLKQILTA